MAFAHPNLAPVRRWILPTATWLVLAVPAAANPWAPAPAAGRAIEGYSSRPGVLAGGRLALHVSTVPRARYRIEVQRLGWYGGAGSRRIACGAACRGQHEGVRRALPHAVVTRPLRAGWPVSTVLAIPRGARSGYYVARLVLTSGPRRGGSRLVPFV